MTEKKGADAVEQRLRELGILDDSGGEQPPQPRDEPAGAAGDPVGDPPEPSIEEVLRAGLNEPARFAPGTPARQRAEEVLTGILVRLGPQYRGQVVEDHEGIRAEITGGDLGTLIGKNGNTLEAIEFLVNVIVNKEVEDQGRVRVSVDAGHYKSRRDERLRQVAVRAADRARATGQPVALEPMSPAERRVVHLALREIPGITSESTGEDPDRRVVVMVAEAEAPPSGAEDEAATS